MIQEGQKVSITRRSVFGQEYCGIFEITGLLEPNTKTDEKKMRIRIDGVWYEPTRVKNVWVRIRGAFPEYNYILDFNDTSTKGLVQHSLYGDNCCRIS
jgi:hypothetical protein